MKSIIKLIGTVCGILIFLWELAEILAIPALLVLIGLLNSFSWQYYAIAIAAYVLIAVIIQVICHLISKRVEKKFESALQRLFHKLFD